MSVHPIKIETHTEYYYFWQGLKKALVVESENVKDFKVWDTIILQNDLPKWKDLPIFRRISFIEDIKGGILLHLKE